MKTTVESHKKEAAKAVSKRDVGGEAEKLPEKQKKLLNLKEESQHSTGEEKLASEKAVREIDGDPE